MSNFNKLYLSLLQEMENSAATAFGPAATGDHGNQFPSQNDMAYAPGDARWPFGKEFFNVAQSKKKKKGKKSRKSKTPKVSVQRRNLGPSM